MNYFGKKIVFISWVHATGRSESVAKEFSAKDFYIEFGKSLPIYLSPIRYLVQSYKTLKIFSGEKPDIIFCMNPPIFLPLLVYIYTIFTKSNFVIDSHTGVFTDQWKYFLFVHKFLSKKALTTIVTNENLKSKINIWGANGFILPLGVSEFPICPDVDESGFSICVINSYANDEPLFEIMQAAREVKSCKLFVTGKIPHIKEGRIFEQKPDNVIFTDYLSLEDYIILLNKVSAIMVLVKRDHTLLQGAIEAVSVEKPLITSDWPVLKKFFYRGTIHVDNSPSGIKEGIIKCMANIDFLANDIKALKKSIVNDWRTQIAELHKIIIEKEEIEQNSRCERVF